MSKHKTINCRSDAKVAIIELNRPKKSNALNEEMRRELLQALTVAAEDKNINVIVMTGGGENFCVGADLEEASQSDYLENVEETMVNEFNPLIRFITECDKPIIVAINGAAAGAGSSLALACDLIVMAKSAYLFQAFTLAGLIPDCGMTWIMCRTIGYHKTFEIIADPKPLHALSCLEMGLANRVVSDESLVSETLEWAQEISLKAPIALMEAKQILRNGMSTNLHRIIVQEAEKQGKISTSHDVREGVQAFLDKRKPVFTGT